MPGKKVQQQLVVASPMHLLAAQLCRPWFFVLLSSTGRSAALLCSPPDAASRPTAWFCGEVVIAKATGCGPTNTALQRPHGGLGQLHQPGAPEGEEQSQECEGNHWAVKASEGSVPSRRPVAPCPWFAPGQTCLVLSSCVTPSDLVC